MSSVLSLLVIAIFAIALAALEVPGMLRAGEIGELWAFVGVGVIAFTLLALVSTSVSFATPDEALVQHIKTFLDPIIQPPPR